MHSTARQAADIARLAHAGRLIIGHFSSREDNHDIFLQQASEVFPVTELAVERQSYTI
jgi:ribonuclease Z